MADRDTQLELKKRARRRLVGALVLAVTAAVVLPMVMDHEPQPVQQDIQIRIPNRDADTFTSRVLPGKSMPTPLPAPAAARPLKQEETAAPNRVVRAEPEAASRSSDAEPHEGAEVRAKALTENSTKEAATQSAAGEARAKTVSDTGQFVVQLGVFADRENARKVQARVKAEGFNSFTETLDASGIAKLRVRAGPFADREAAEQAREKLKRAGLNGIVATKS